MHILEILNITKGSLINKIDLNFKINKFKTNSKEVKKNDCFIALNNGHKYIEEAIKNGASLIIVNRKKTCNTPTILVQNMIKVLGGLASYIRKIYNPKVIAITGSVGKTTTRELIYSILSKKYKCHQNKKNYNNHIGVPLTIFDLDKNDEIAIIEMGMNHLNEIKYLSKMVTPNIAVITNIGSSHIGNLGSKENILKAKLEIKEGLKGPLFVNGDDELLKHEYAIKSGFNENNDLIAYNLKSNLYSSSFNININNHTYQIKINLPSHLISNVLIAINIALYLNIDINDQLIESFSSFGADIPFFIRGGCAWVSGIGEKIQNYDFTLPYNIILIYPNIHVSTKLAYSKFTTEDFNKSDLFYIKNMLDNKDINFEKIVSKTYNVFEKNVFNLEKRIEEIKNKIESIIKRKVTMSGSGSSLFTLYDKDDEKIEHDFHKLINEMDIDIYKLSLI